MASSSTCLLRLLSSTAATSGNKVELHGLVSPLRRPFPSHVRPPLVKTQALSSTPLVLFASTNESDSKNAAVATVPTQQPTAASRTPFDYWDPFTLSSTRSLSQMMNFMDRLFGDRTTFTNSDLVGYTRTPWDIIEDEDSFQMRIDLPGFDKDEVKVSVEDGVLVVSAQHNKEEAKDDKWSRRMRGSYYTRIALPKTVETNKVAAKLSNGVLEITIPKTKKEKHVVDVKLE